MSNSLHFELAGALRTLVAPTLFGLLAEHIRLALLGRAPVLQFSDGQIIQHKGDEPNGFWVIRQGTVKVGQFQLNGEFRAIALLAAGDSYGELAMFAGTRRAVDSLADGPVALHWIDACIFEAEIMSDIVAMRKMIGAMAVQLQEMINLVAGLGSGTSKARIAAVLANLASADTAGSVVALSQQDLAELTGLTRATVNKCLAELEQSGALMRHYGKIEILRTETLRTLALG